MTTNGRGGSCAADGATTVTLTCEGLVVVHRRGDVDGAVSSDHGSRCSDRRARSSPFSTLPLALSGSALTTSTRRGTL